MKKRILAVLIMVTVLTTCFTCTSYGASSTKKMVTYNIVKKKQIVYCAAKDGIYRVDLKNGSVKPLVITAHYVPIDSDPLNMSVYREYVYYQTASGISSNLYRVRTTGGKAKKLAPVEEYAIKNGKIYYEEHSAYSSKRVMKVMNLNGKKKHKTRCRIKMKYKKTNAKGYSMVTEFSGKVWEDYDDGTREEFSSFSDYLVTPSGVKIKLNTYIDFFAEYD